MKLWLMAYPIRLAMTVPAVLAVYYAQTQIAPRADSEVGVGLCRAALWSMPQ